MNDKEIKFVVRTPFLTKHSGPELCLMKISQRKFDMLYSIFFSNQPNT